MTDRVYNFSPGPAVLPEAVLEEVQRDLMALPGVGSSVLEISHRSSAFDSILEEAEANLRELLVVPEGFQVLFLQGGARMHFSLLPMNFLRGRTAPATFLLTGSWGNKAIEEAVREGSTHVAWDGKEEGFVRVPNPEELDVPTESAYVHYTSNETIQGVQFQEPPPSAAFGGAPLLCDASSDFLSRPVDLSDHGVLYACSQKNAGAAGLVVSIVRDDLLERVPEGLHAMFDLKRLAESGSRLNTPNVFGVYVFLLITRWVRDEMGGLAAMEEHNRRKAALLYDLLDEDDGEFYAPHARPESRSAMNVTFRLQRPELQDDFLEAAARQGLVQLKGHRSVGGFRASIYNAMPVAGVERLAAFLGQFKASNS